MKASARDNGEEVVVPAVRNAFLARYAIHVLPVFLSPEAAFLVSLHKRKQFVRTSRTLT